MCSRIGQNFQEGWSTPIIATFIKRINDEDESMVWFAREIADKVKEESAFHRLRTQVWVVAKAIHYAGSKGGEDSGEFVDEGRKDISVLAQIRVVPPAEEGSSKPLLIMKACTDRMCQ